MPAAGRQSSEERMARGFFVEMERLGIEFSGECLDSLLVDPQPAGTESLPDAVVFEISTSFVDAVDAVQVLRIPR